MTVMSMGGRPLVTAAGTMIYEYYHPTNFTTETLLS